MLVFEFLLFLALNLLCASKHVAGMQKQSFDLVQNNICFTKHCLKESEEFINSMNFSINPCDDFYTFACENWIRKERIPETETKWEPFTELQKRINLQLINLLKEPIKNDEHKFVKETKKFFMACENIDALEKIGNKPLIEILNSFGGWPMIAKYWFSDGFCWQNIMIELYRLFGLNVFFQFSIERDLKNDQINHFHIGKISTIFPPFILNDANNYPKEITAYGKWILRTAEELRATQNEHVAFHSMKIEAFEIVDLEIKLSNLLDRNLSGDFPIYEKYLTIKQLQKITDNFDTTNKINWMYVMVNIFKETSIKISMDTQVVVPDINYIQEFLKLVDVTPPRVLANYIMWHLVNFFNRDTTSKLRQLSDDINRVVLGFKKGLKRVEECKDQTEKYFGKVISHLYVSRYFNETTQNQVRNISELIRDTIKNRLENSDWMDDSTKSEAIEKVNYLKLVIGYAQNSNDLDDLNLSYPRLALGTNHLNNVVRLAKLTARNNLLRLNKTNTKNELLVFPTNVNAFNYRNTIYVLAGILNFPFYENDRIIALNFGSIGFLIGHEIVHSFDNKGRLLNKNGNLVEWWDPKTLQIFNNKTQCFVSQYNNYTGHIAELSKNYHINGLLTVGENIADSVGLSLAFEAYEKFVEITNDKRLPGIMSQFSPKQLFFISFAKTFCEKITNEALFASITTDPHTTNEFRVIGAVSNSKEFANVFNCALNAPMNPNKKCTLW